MDSYLVCAAAPPPSVSRQKVYGEPLLSHLSQSNREIAAPIAECVHMLLRTGMREEVQTWRVSVCVRVCRTSLAVAPLLLPQGLFRLAAAASVVKRLKTCLDHGTVDHGEFSMDPHAVAGKRCARVGSLRSQCPLPL